MTNREQIVLISEPLLRTGFSQHQFVSGLAGRLQDRFDFTIAAPAIGPECEESLRAQGFQTLSGNMPYPPTRGPRDEPPSFAESWLLDATLGVNGRWLERRLQGNRALRLNFSMTTAVRSDIWYFQSQPLSDSLRAFLPNLNPAMRFAARVGLPFIDHLDRIRLAQDLGGNVPRYTSSRFVAQSYERRGLRVTGQVPAYPYPTNFSATTQNPSRDYALVYLGKETDTQAVRELIHLGMPVRIFGGKSADWVSGALGHDLPPNVEMCGYVSHDELCELYTNALFTAFPFTDESFGLVPIESMGCGTPVLTYAMQGPAETVVDGFTGWLAYNSAQFVEAARRLFHRGYPPGMQGACVERAEWFSLPNAARLWTDVLTAQLDGRPELPRPPAAPSPQKRWDGFLSMRELVGPA
jgi:hypothetical protein